MSGHCGKSPGLADWCEFFGHEFGFVVGRKACPRAPRALLVAGTSSPGPITNGATECGTRIEIRSARKRRRSLEVRPSKRRQVPLLGVGRATGLAECVSNARQYPAATDPLSRERWTPSFGHRGQGSLSPFHQELLEIPCDIASLSLSFSRSVYRLTIPPRRLQLPSAAIRLDTYGLPPVA